MQKPSDDFEEDEGPLTEGEYEEGLDDEYDDEDEDEDYDEGADVLEELGDEEDEDGDDEGFVRGLEPLQGVGQAGLPRRQAAGPSTKPWRGLESLPVTTREKYVKFLGQLRSHNKREITILVLGKYYTGKSLTVNSLLNEDAATPSLLQRNPGTPAVHSREAHGFKLNIIDAAWLNDADVVSEHRMEGIASAVQERPIDVLLYVDRLDLYRTDGTDEQVVRAISKTLGSAVWKNAILGLTYAGETVNGYEWGDFSKKRAERLQQAVRRFSKCPDAALPVALIENSRSCPENSDGEKILPDKTAWLPTLMEKITEMATSQPAFEFDQQAVDRASNPNRKFRWLVPVIFAAQIAFKVLVFDRMTKDDSLEGDKHGPFEPNVVRANKARAAMEKEVAKKQAQRKPVQRVTYYDSDSD